MLTANLVKYLSCRAGAAMSYVVQTLTDTLLGIGYRRSLDKALYVL